MSLLNRSTASFRSAVLALGALPFVLVACGGTAASEDVAAEVAADTEPLALTDSTTEAAGADQTSAGVAANPGDGASSPTESTTSSRATLELTSAAGLVAVCGGSTFSNLTPSPDEPRKIAFVENYTSEGATFAVAADTSLGDTGYDHSVDDLLDLDYVGCIIEVSRQRSELSCTVADANGDPVGFDVFELNLAVRIVDAVTGAEVALEPVAAALESCPTGLTVAEDVLSPIEPAQLRTAVERHLSR